MSKRAFATGPAIAVRKEYAANQTVSGAADKASAVQQPAGADRELNEDMAGR